ncbi:hypothetical protein ACFU99_12025 [Streptomyces sp. NPDC057654]|uniref:hypothetical protein n=1 Tax=Streptomyces sp. NPDC057654 TaxID=3346196 RepID=UPI003688C592
MHDHENSERLASYADVLGGELPGSWTSSHHPPPDRDALADLADRVWDLDLVAAFLAEQPLREAAVLSRPDGAQFAVLDRHDNHGGFLIAALALPDLPDEAYRDVPEPNGIALTDDPFRSAERVADDLLARYDTALAQARHNAAAGVEPSQPERVVLTWQQDGALAAAPVGETATAILVAAGFVQDPQTGICRLGGDDSAAQAGAVREAGRRLDAHGITTALQHPSGRTTPTTQPAAAPPAPTAPRSPAARTR